ncbi:MAG: hypothetical protein RIR22_2434, partial [Planctomycetota bacterium]
PAPVAREPLSKALREKCSLFLHTPDIDGLFIVIASHQLVNG